MVSLLLSFILFSYFGVAIWKGKSCRVYLVNGTNKPYSITVQGTEYHLQPLGAIPIRVPEGELEVVFSDAKLKIEPIQARIETNFWLRPFINRTYVVNPDQTAVILEEERYYAQINPPAAGPPTESFGKAFYELPECDYPFQDFPQTIVAKQYEKVRKTRVGLVHIKTTNEKLARIQKLEQAEQMKLCQKWLKIDPNNTSLLYWVAFTLPATDAIAFLETVLDEKPYRFEWQRTYQILMESVHPETDLSPRFRKLLSENPGNADVLYLLSRAEPDPVEAEKIFQQAANASPPSGYALSALGMRELCQGHFTQACHFYEKALPLSSNNPSCETYYCEALFANGEYDSLMTFLQKSTADPEKRFNAMLQMARIYAARGNHAMVRDTLSDAFNVTAIQRNHPMGRQFQPTLACYEKDVDGYLKALGVSSTFEASFLRGNVKQAENLIDQNDPNALVYRGLLFLEAIQSNNPELIGSYRTALLTELEKGDREEKIYANILAGREPLNISSMLELAIEPEKKRVLLVILAKSYPTQAQEFLSSAKMLDYHHDAVSLCLHKFNP